jgi:transcriptional regulator GlxA family with amidase domain
LLAAVPGVETVEGVARHHGFNHLGRFSKKYQSHFGELPSETLYRRP